MPSHSGLIKIRPSGVCKKQNKHHAVPLLNLSLLYVCDDVPCVQKEWSLYCNTPCYI